MRGTVGLGCSPFLHEGNLSFQEDVPFYSVSFFLEAGDIGLTAAMVGRVRAPGGPSPGPASVCPLPASHASDGVPKPLLSFSSPFPLRTHGHLLPR